MIQGIDVSHNQGPIDVAAVRAAGFRFCVAKATEGVDYEDCAFRRTLAAVAALPPGGLPFYAGAYHFARPDNHPGRSGGEDEAGQFSRVLAAAAAECGLSLTSGYLEPALDFEKYCDDESCGTADHSEWIDGFLGVLVAETGRRGMIYTGANVWRYQAGDTDRFASAGVPLWQVGYTSRGADPAATPPRIPSDPARAPWPAAIWQWSGGGEFAYYGRVPGVDGDVDIDRLMGDESLLSALAAATPPAATLPTQPWPPPVDLSTLAGASHPYTARVQGCLLALGFGPDGLVSRTTGRPDGYFGAQTEAALRQFKRGLGLADDARIDDATWFCLINSGIR
ncbi:GH25 family lysozyme [Nannocystis bainbridge]|uniref:GH25 family lysozyme n=1 Tax=Nannocystis bainbridge TaxID=2995303 RepID=A0ABT5DRE3_9BACT|nr:GH25 family lysozyme [Nannocystis bainbridge]MDC0716164.1 GH25 family lysozyme [Nannocystis bainbridge]